MDQMTRDGGGSESLREGSVVQCADGARATPLSGLVLALSVASFAIYLASSEAVRFVLAEIVRLFGKFAL